MKKKLPIKKLPEPKGERDGRGKKPGRRGCNAGKRSKEWRRLESGPEDKLSDAKPVGRPGCGNAVKPQTCGAYQRLDPEGMNHLLLIQMQEHVEDKEISTCEINPRTRISRQHYRKLRPRPGEQDIHVTFVTVIRWCNETEKSIQRVIEDILEAFGKQARGS